MNLKSFYLIFIFSFSFCQENTKYPNDVKWVTKSKEYKILCEQIYFNAWKSIKKEVKNSKEAVIIMDLDETVLDNSKYQIELFKKSEKYNPKSWNKWVEKEEADLVPGAKKFILKFKDKDDSKIIFLSNRDNSTIISTKRNMKKLGILFEDDIFLLKKNSEDSKIKRRKEVLLGINRMEEYGSKKIIAYFGDAFGDFPEDKKYKFGVNNFIFPNPMYGKW